ncbi:MAG: hypothetical protein OCD02_24025 [Spirochaetaceae bacterium]
MKKVILLLVITFIFLVGCVTNENTEVHTNQKDKQVFELKYTHIIQFDESGFYDPEATEVVLDLFFKSHPSIIELSYEYPNGSITVKNNYHDVKKNDNLHIDTIGEYFSSYREIYYVSFIDEGQLWNTSFTRYTEQGGEISAEYFGKYTMYLSQDSTRAYNLENPLDIKELDNLKIGEIVLINDPDISKYAFFYYVPESAVSGNITKTALMGMGSPGSTYKELSVNYLNKMYSHKRFADEYNYAVILMLIPQKAQYLFQNSMILREIENEFWERPDLEYRNVINRFMDELEVGGLNPHRKVYMTGFSNGGSQSSIFPLLHPDMVEATAPGSAGTYVYPANSMNGTELTWPMGLADLHKIDGATFIPELYKEVEQFIFVGTEDNDPINDAANEFYDRDATAFYRDFAGKTPVERVPLYASYLKEYGVNIEYKIYEGIGHDWTDEMMHDVFNFFESIPMNIIE